MNLSEPDRQRLFDQAQSIDSNLGIPFQNPLWLDTDIIDEEFDRVESFEQEIQLYKDQLHKIKVRIG